MNLFIALSLSVGAAFAQPANLTEKIETDESGAVKEITWFKEGDSRPFRKKVLHVNYGSPAIYEAEYMTTSSSDLRLRELKIFPVDAEMTDAPSAILHSIDEVNPSNFSSKPPAALIIDSGFFPKHPDLVGKHYLDPVTKTHTLRGTLGKNESVKYTSNENEMLLMPLSGRGAPFSHGTSIASIAFRGIEHTSFIGTHGDIFATAFLFRMIDLIRQHDIRFTNMSFGFGDSSGASMIDPADHEALENFVRFQPEVLHVIAAGNHGVNFDETTYSEKPACIRSLNSVVVGGLATDEIKESELPNLKRSKMASHGVRCVDIMAPAEKVEGAWLWPLRAKVSGTSVAAPFVLNVLLQMHAVNSKLSARTYRELLLKTAYVPRERDFAVRSGGIVHPRRAVLATERHSSGLSVDDAVRASREEIHDGLEINSEAELQALWETNKLVF